MRAITYSQFGGPEVLEISDVEPPIPGPGRIRVAVRAAGLNPYDSKVRTGMFGGDLPKRLGNEFAGTVDALGPDVDDVAVGDTVFGLAIGGAEAEFTLSAHYASVPEGLDFVAAAALPVALETAYRLLDLVGVAPGSTVLINGASGAVGQTAVQVAVDRGAHVIGTASQANQELLRGLGAEPVLYGDGLGDRVRALGVSELDAGIDCSGGGILPDLVELTGGPEHVVTIADYDGAQATGVSFSGQSSAFYGLNDVARLIAAGRFSLPVVATFTFDQVVDAYRTLEAPHAPGKLVLTL